MGAVVQMWDSLRNAITGAGTSRDPRAAYRHFATALSQIEIEQAYRGSGLMRKIIQIPAMDMVREWRDWKLEAEQITDVEAEEKRHMIRQKVRQAEVLRGLGGGALILGLPGNPSEPAASSVGKQGLAYVHVVSRWHLTFAKLQDDAREAGFGEPAMWKMQSAGLQMDIHPSRVIPFRADTSASLAMTAQSFGADQFWGESTVAQVLDAVTDSDAARGAFASLLHKARLMRIGIPGLSDTVSRPGGTASVQARLEVIALAESMFNATIFDSGSGGKDAETITDADYDFTGAKDVINAYAEFVSAVSDIPATRLLGRAPEGLNSSGDSQQKDWQKKVKAQQELDLSPCMDRLDAYLVPSALGSIPPGTWWAWAPLDTPGEKENAERFKAQMEAIDKLANMGVIPERALSRGVQSLMIDEGYLPELETALAEIPEAERWGIEPSSEEIDNPAEGGGQQPAVAGKEPPDPAVLLARAAANDAKPIPLYVSRKLLNAAELIAWAKAQGMETTLPAGDMHVTVLFSRSAVDPLKMGETWSSEENGGLTVKAGGPRAVEKLGESAVVLLFASWSLVSRHNEMVREGASHDFPEYQPHVTITHTAPEGLDLDAIKPFAGELRFGPEIFEPLDLDWKAKIEEA